MGASLGDHGRNYGSFAGKVFLETADSCDNSNQNRNGKRAYGKIDRNFQDAGMDTDPDRKAGRLALAEASQSLDFGASTMLSSTPSAASHLLGAGMASLGSEGADYDDDSCILTNDMILEMFLSINNQDVEPSVVPGSYRGKYNPSQAPQNKDDEPEAEVSRQQRKEHEEKMK